MGSKCANKVTVFVEVPYTAYSLFNKLTCFENTCLGDTCTPESHLSSLNLIFQNINIKIVLDYKISTHINICISIYTHWYAGQEATVRTGHGTTDWFQIGKGGRQGCILSPCLFNLYAEYIMRNAGLDEAQLE